MKCLLLYASFGDGHAQVAAALKRVLSEQYEADVHEVDTFRQTSTALAKLNEWIYETTTRYVPFLYGLSYDVTKTFHPRHPLWRVLAWLSRPATWRIVQSYEPDVVIQLFPDHALAKLPEMANKPLLVTVLTDYAVHSRWFHDNVDIYLFPSERTREEASPFLTEKSKAVVTGIPIREQFSMCSLTSAQQDAFVAISTGGRGVFPDLEAVIACLLDECRERRVIVLCGRNERMRRVVESFKMKHPCGELVEAVGYTTEMASYIQRASFVIAKAGGVSTAELLASGTPIVFYRPLQGQELDNARLVEQTGAGVVVRHVRQLRHVVRQWTPEVEAQIRAACIANGRPYAALEAAYVIQSRLHG